MYMSDAIFYDCPSAAIFYITTYNGILVGTLNLYAITPTSTPDVVGQRNRKRGITFRAALKQLDNILKKFLYFCPLNNDFTL